MVVWAGVVRRTCMCVCVFIQVHRPIGRTTDRPVDGPVLLDALLAEQLPRQDQPQHLLHAVWWGFGVAGLGLGLGGVGQWIGEWKWHTHAHTTRTHTDPLVTPNLAAANAHAPSPPAACLRPRTCPRAQSPSSRPRPAPPAPPPRSPAAARPAPAASTSALRCRRCRLFLPLLLLLPAWLLLPSVGDVWCDNGQRAMRDGSMAGRSIDWAGKRAWSRQSTHTPNKDDDHPIEGPSSLDARSIERLGTGGGLEWREECVRHRGPLDSATRRGLDSCVCVPSTPTISNRPSTPDRSIEAGRPSATPRASYPESGCAAAGASCAFQSLPLPAAPAAVCRHQSDDSLAFHHSSLLRRRPPCIPSLTDPPHPDHTPTVPHTNRSRSRSVWNRIAFVETWRRQRTARRRGRSTRWSSPGSSTCTTRPSRRASRTTPARHTRCGGGGGNGGGFWVCVRECVRGWRLGAASSSSSATPTHARTHAHSTTLA